jgi:hypothetical protein
MVQRLLMMLSRHVSQQKYYELVELGIRLVTGDWWDVKVAFHITTIFVGPY